MSKVDMKNPVHNVMEGGGAKKSNLVGMTVGGKASGNMPQRERTALKIVDIPVGEITPRPINNYRQYRIDNLAESIRNTHNTLIHPIVVCKPTDLPEDHEVRAKFEESGTDITAIKYVVVAGERRFRAWMQLWQEEEEHPTNRNKPNPFNLITARILTREEAQDEMRFYAESNDEARQLTALEGLLHIRSVIDEVQTDEQKVDAIKQMKEAGYDVYANMDIPKDIVKAAKKFNQAKFCHYYFTEELGIDSFSLDSIKWDLAVFNNCCEEVIDAIMKDGFAIGAARNLVSLSKNPTENKELQKGLIKVWKESGADAYKEELEQIKSGNGKAKAKGHITHKDAKKCADGIIKHIQKDRKSFKEIADKLGKDEQESAKKILKELDDCMAKIQSISNKFVE